MKNISVGATLNSVLSSVLRSQYTIIKNCAIEPEIENVINFLNKAGCKIKLDTKKREIKVKGIDRLKEIRKWKVPADRISGMTYFLFALMQNKSAILHISSDLVRAPVKKLQEIGYPIKIKNNKIIYERMDKLQLQSQNIDFRPYPDIPTDLQPIFCLLMSRIKGKSKLDDQVYSQRTQYIKQLQKLGVNVEVESINGKHIINVSYSPILRGNNVECTDIRGGITILLATLLADGNSSISNEYQIKRGYNSFVKTLVEFGFNISDSENDNNFIQKFIKSQWSLKIDESWEQYHTFPILHQNSKICVLGDCFARNFSRWFSEKGMNVTNIPWGIHFHQKAILRELKKVLKEDNTPDVFWSLLKDSKKISFIDPFRHPVEAYTLEELKQKQNVIEESKTKYLREVDLFVISLSIAEVWEEKINDQWQALGRGPTEENFNPEIHRYRTLTTEETKRDIIDIISTVKKINQTSKIVFMVSPVPLKHSLHKEHIYISNSRSKTTLLNAIYEIMDTKPENVFYFPAYEIIQKDNKKEYWQDDLRHPTAECVSDICQHFVKLFCSDNNVLNNNKNRIFQVKEVDKFGNITRDVQENTYFLKEARYKLAKKIDKRLGTNIRKIEMPRLIEKSERKLNNIYQKLKTHDKRG